MFIHFHLVDIRHFHKYIVVHFLTLFWLPYWLSALDSRPVCLNVAQAMLFQVTAAGTAPSINYRT